MSASDPSSLGASPSPSSSSSTPFLPRLIKSLSVQYQVYLDKSVPLSTFRWLLFTGFVFLYFLRVYAVEGFYIVTYGLGIFLLNLFIGFLSPLDEEMLDEGRGPMLPLSDDAEFKPFVRRLPEFKFWHSCLKAVIVALLMTLFPMFDVPVFWPILLIYFIILFILTMRRQIQHMIKHKYLPFNLGKKKYQKGGGPAGTAGGGLAAMLGTATGGAGAGGQKMKVAEDIRTR